MSDSEQCSNRLELDLISILVNFSCELNIILFGLVTDHQLVLMMVLIDQACPKLVQFPSQVVSNILVEHKAQYKI